MTKYSCPSCGADVVFQSWASIFVVCQYCKSTLIRKDVDLESIGKMSDLKDDASVLQLGASGKLEGGFTLIGRVRVSWSDGFWNEWYAQFTDGRFGWLAEAQGFYMLSFGVDVPEKLPKAAELKIGSRIRIGKIGFEVDDIKQVSYTFAEGELPFMAPQGFKGTSVDLSEGEANFASISYGAQSDIDVFVGKYHEFGEFHFQNLRQLDGW